MKSQSKRRLLVAGLLFCVIPAAFAGKQRRMDLQTLVTPRYTVEGDAFRLSQR